MSLWRMSLRWESWRQSLVLMSSWCHVMCYSCQKVIEYPNWQDLVKVHLHVRFCGAFLHCVLAIFAFALASDFALGYSFRDQGKLKDCENAIQKRNSKMQCKNAIKNAIQYQMCKWTFTVGWGQYLKVFYECNIRLGLVSFSHICSWWV